MTDSSVNKPVQTETDEELAGRESTKRPDDAAGISVQGHIKIYDPESGEILINKRTC